MVCEDKMVCEVCKDKINNNYNTRPHNDSILCQNCFDLKEEYLKGTPLNEYIVGKHIVVEPKSGMIAICKIVDKDNYIVRISIDYSETYVLGRPVDKEHDAVLKENQMFNCGMVCFIKSLTYDWDYTRIKITGVSKNQRALFAICINN